jgi:hypothetical protein
MKHLLFVAALYVLFPFNIASPAPRYVSSGADLGVKFPNEALAQEPQIASNQCRSQEGEDGSAIIQRLSIYASKLVGERGTKWIFHSLRIKVLICEGDSNLINKNSKAMVVTLTRNRTVSAVTKRRC